jgi:hypothetical protein
MSDEYTRGLLEARRAYAQVWANVTRREIHEVDFTTQRFTDELRSRWFERRWLHDGTVPSVGQRVVTVRETAERWHMPHAHDSYVHEITSLLGGDTHLVECGPTQMGVALLAQAPAGSEVTCPSCKGWHAFREKSRIDAEVYRAEQFRRTTSNDLIKRLANALIDGSPIIPGSSIGDLLTEATRFVHGDE